MKKYPREKNEAHLKFIRGLPCCVCGNPHETEAAHIRMPDISIGKRPTGMGEKPDDCFALPLCGNHHRRQHLGDEYLWWKAAGIDPFKLSLALWRWSGDQEKCEEIIVGNYERVS